MHEIEARFRRIAVTRKTGGEHFVGANVGPQMTVLEFWRWAASDLISNTMRGVLAEFIVASALDIAYGVRTEWDAFDLLTADNVRIEVKSAAYLQSWRHENLSKIIFGIRPTRGWDASTNVASTNLKRQADIYVFCLLSHQDQETLNPLDLNQWDFYALRSEMLDQACPTQKTIGLGGLLKLNPLHAKYPGLANCIHELKG